MDVENGKLDKGVLSAAGVFKPLENPRQIILDDDDDEDDDYEELATPKETDGSEDTTKVLHQEISDLRLDRSDLQRRIVEIMAEMEHSEAGERSLAAHAAQLEAELSRATSEAESLRLASRAIEADKANLDAGVRDLDARIADLEREKEKKESEIRSVKECLKIEREKAAATEKKREDEIVSLKEELKKWKKAVETVRNIEDVASLKDELRIVEENAKEVGIENEKASDVDSKKVGYVGSLKEELNVAREKAGEEVKESARVALTQQEEMIVSLKEELRLVREKGREELEIERQKMTAAVAEKESEVATLRQELKFAREKGMEELEVRNRKLVAEKEVEIDLAKGKLKQLIITAGIREEELEREAIQLKEFISELEGKIRELHTKVTDDVLVQGNRGGDLIEREGPKLYWVTAAALAASSGTVAAAITAFCLRHSREK